MLNNNSSSTPARASRGVFFSSPPPSSFTSPPPAEFSHQLVRAQPHPSATAATYPQAVAHRDYAPPHLSNEDEDQEMIYAPHPSATAVARCANEDQDEEMIDAPHPSAAADEAQDLSEAQKLARDPPPVETYYAQAGQFQKKMDESSKLLAEAKEFLEEEKQQLHLALEDNSDRLNRILQLEEHHPRVFEVGARGKKPPDKQDIQKNVLFLNGKRTSSSAHKAFLARCKIFCLHLMNSSFGVGGGAPRLAPTPTTTGGKRQQPSCDRRAKRSRFN